jgi:hypothetical protein
VNEGVFTVRQAGAAVGGGVGVATEGVVPPQPISKAAKRTILIVSMSKRDIREVDIAASFFGYKKHLLCFLAVHTNLQE